MGYRLSPLQLSYRVEAYLEELYSPEYLKHAFWCMDTRVFDDPDVAFYPDIENRFKSLHDALVYLIAEGLPIWLVREGTNYPLQHFTLLKLELLFDL